MHRTSILSSLPGFNFDRNLGKTKFHKSHHFDKIHNGIYYLSEKMDTCSSRHYLPTYFQDNMQETPAWLAYDGQRLTFKAVFYESAQERWKTAFRIVNISFFLEDGTMKITEPPIDNSGLEQGVLVRRQRIPMPDPVKYRHYDILDLNIGKEVEIYGRVYKIVDCDKFTRRFLNRMGISVPDPIDLPKDSIQAQKTEVFPKKPSRSVDTLGKYLKYDKQVLRFYGYWDDTESLHGIVHDLELYYHLSDNTIEIKENIPPNAGRDSGATLVKRTKIPKFYSGLQSIGAQDPSTILNVLGENTIKSYHMMDSLEVGKIPTDYYSDNELGIGAEINVFGRKIVITDMDVFTKEYYRLKYGLDDFTPLERPRRDELCERVEKHVPPYNGFGSYDDSLGNCFTIVPKSTKTDFVKFLYRDKQGFNSHVLRFRAKMISTIADDEEREFIIRIFLVDDTISVFELAKRNSGFQKSLFQKRMLVILPNQDIFTNKKPKYYKPQDFYIGASINLCGFRFKITSADVYTLRYMELHYDEFPKANKKLIMEKLREDLRSIYNEFVKTYAPPKDTKNNIRVLEYEKFKEAFHQYMGDKITEHEIITIARYYSYCEKVEHRSKEYIRRLLHTELHRSLWHDLDRLEESLHHWDRDRTGHLSRESLYTILRGCRVPVHAELLNSMLDHLHKSDDGKINYNDLLQFMNLNIDPPPLAAPISTKMVLCWTEEKEPDYRYGINWCEFIKDLDIGVE